MVKHLLSLLLQKNQHQPRILYFYLLTFFFFGIYDINFQRYFTIIKNKLIYIEFLNKVFAKMEIDEKNFL